MIKLQRAQYQSSPASEKNHVLKERKTLVTIRHCNSINKWTNKMLVLIMMSLFFSFSPSSLAPFYLHFELFLDSQNCQLKKVSYLSYCILFCCSCVLLYLPWSFSSSSRLNPSLCLPFVRCSLGCLVSSCREVPLGAGPGTVWGPVGSNPAAGCVHLLCKATQLCARLRANAYTLTHTHAPVKMCTGWYGRCSCVNRLV